MQPDGHHLAELNIGRLLAPTDDPRVAEFMEALDRVNGMGKRMPISSGTRCTGSFMRGAPNGSKYWGKCTS
jgi:hypothetical protein